MSEHRRHTGKIIVGILISIGCLAWAVKDVNWSDVGTSLSRAEYQWAPIYLLLLAAFYWLKAIRWSMLLNPIKPISASRVAGPMMVGFMGNNILPGHVGEFFRVFIIWRQEKISIVSTLTSVVVERIFDVIAVMILVSISMLGISGLSPDWQQRFQAVGLLALGGMIIVAIGLIWLKQAVSVGKWIIHRMPVPEHFRHKLSHLIDSASDGLQAVRNGKQLFLILGNSIIQWGCNIGMIYISLISFGIEVTPLAAFLLLGVLVFAVTIPSTPGFFGLVQIAFTETLKLFAIAESTSFAASIYYHLLQYIPVTLIGFWCLARTGLSLSELQHDAEEIEETLEEDSESEIAVTPS